MHQNGDNWIKNCLLRWKLVCFKVCCLKTKFPTLNEPPRDKTNKMICAPSEDSDQPGHPPSLIKSWLYAQWIAKDLSFFHANNEDSDQSGQMPRLIWVFARRTYHFGCFVMRRLKSMIYLPKWHLLAQLYPKKTCLQHFRPLACSAPETS